MKNKSSYSNPVPTIPPEKPTLTETSGLGKTVLTPLTTAGTNLFDWHGTNQPCTLPEYHADPFSLPNLLLCFQRPALHSLAAPLSAPCRI